MKKPGKRTILYALTLLFLVIISYVIFSTDKVKKQTARIFDMEFIPNQHFDINQTEAFAQKDSIYRHFRSHCLFHFQTTGLAKFNDSSYLFVISEPAPYVHRDSIVQIFKKFNIYSEIKTHPMGYDGWVKDMVVCVGRATTENINHINKALSKILYLSDYKPFTLPLPLDTTRIYFSSNNLNYRISLSEINQWFMEDKESFVDLPDTTTVFDLPTMLKKRKSGVFYSKQPGFVVWSIDKKKDIHQQKQFIRKFTLDADLVLGAVSDSATLVIIGRERESDVLELPPLNVETILLLASIKDGELSQSLDINDLLAGKMSNDKDWCPTYLSPQLEHTEFGHLLTITDVLLKDWSENGTLHYENYHYPKPPHYPFDRPLFGKLGLNELVYNWNTANTMFAYDENGINFYALNRTGSLPVSYFNSQAHYISAGERYENTAYQYFSGLCNTDLIRVVQYTSLYQLFIDNDMICQGDSTHYAAKNKPYLLYGAVKALLTNIKNLASGQLDSITQEVGTKNFKKYQQAQLYKDMDAWEQNNRQSLADERKEEIFRDVQNQSKSALRSELLTLQTRLHAMNDKDFTALCKYLSYPRGNQLSNADIRKIYGTAYQTIQAIYAFGKPNLRRLGMDLASVKNTYAASLKNSASPWMKTPSLIISYNSPRLTGGHNLSSKIRRVNSINADKTIVASGRPQYVPRETNPSTPVVTKPAPASSNKPRPNKQQANTSQPRNNKQSPSSGGTPVRKRTDVISTSARTHRGF